MHICNLLLQLSHLFFLQHFFVFDRDYLDELVYVMSPVIEQDACQFGTGVEVMLADEFVQLLAVEASSMSSVPPFPCYRNNRSCRLCSIRKPHRRTYLRQSYVPSVRVLPHVRRSCIRSNGHPHPLLRLCTGVADGKAFAYTAVDIYFTACCAIKQGVTGDRIFLRLEIAAYRGQYGDTSATQILCPDNHSLHLPA